MDLRERFVFYLFLFSFLSLTVGAASTLPIGLQKIIDYNTQYSMGFALQISFVIAFLAGILSILSPCILPLLPSYFSYTFKEKRNITFMTLIFFAGFSTSFITMGIIAGFLGAQVLTVVQSPILLSIAGAAILIFGVMELMGKGFSSLFTNHFKFKNDLFGVYFFGIFFAIGWTACLGPILAGILSLGAILHDTFRSGFLLFFYSLGIMVPLFLLSVFYDHFNLRNSSFVKGRMFTFSFLEKTYKIHSTRLLSGMLLFILGAVILIFQGTGIVNSLDLFGTKQYFYTFQRLLLEWKYATITGAVLLSIFSVLVLYFVLKERKK